MNDQWSDWQKHVINKLESLDDRVSNLHIDMNTKIAKVDIKVSSLRSKVATISTFIGTVLGTLAHFVSKKLGV